MKTTNTEINKGYAEFLFAFYYSSFTILKPLLNTFREYSTIILFGMALLVVLIFLYCSKFKLNKQKTNRLLILFAFVTCVFLFDFVFRRSSTTWECYYYYLIYGVIPLLLMTGINDFSKLTKYWCFFALIGGIEFFFDPFNSYKWSGDYMQFGTGIMLPAFASAVILSTYYKKRVWYVVALGFLVNLLINANKGAFLSAIAILIIGVVYFSNKGKVSARKIILLVILAIIPLFMFEQIVEFLLLHSKKIGISSYSLRTFQYMLSDNQNGVYSTRINIWMDAWREFKSHFLVGSGIGVFADSYGNYAHNFMLDILVSHGCIIALIVFKFLIDTITKLLDAEDRDFKIFSAIMFSLWFFPTLVSHTFWKIMPFWCFVGLGLYYTPQKSR